jgi:hypothetical protein
MDSAAGLANTTASGTVTRLATHPPAMKITGSPGLTPLTPAPVLGLNRRIRAITRNGLAFRVVAKHEPVRLTLGVDLDFDLGSVTPTR